MRVIISPKQKSEHKRETRGGNLQVRSEIEGMSACGDARHAFRKNFALKISTLILTFTSDAVVETKLFLFISF